MEPSYWQAIRPYTVDAAKQSTLIKVWPTPVGLAGMVQVTVVVTVAVGATAVIVAEIIVE